MGERSTANVINSTFVNNAAATSGAAIEATATRVTALIYSNIFAGNVPSQDQVKISSANETEDASFNLFDTEGLIGDGSHNILNANPLFTDRANGDYTLQPGSPAIDAGNSSLYVGGPLTDFAGNARGQDDPSTTDTGEAVIGAVIDMGAFEFNINAEVDDCPADVDGDGAVNVSDLLGFLGAYRVGC